MSLRGRAVLNKPGFAIFKLLLGKADLDGSYLNAVRVGLKPESSSVDGFFCNIDENGFIAAGCCYGMALGITAAGMGAVANSIC